MSQGVPAMVLARRPEFGISPTQAAQSLGKAVVSTASGEHALRAALGVDEFPGRSRVVVEPTHQRGHELVPNSEGVEVSPPGIGDERLAARAERRLDRGYDRLDVPFLVEDVSGEHEVEALFRGHAPVGDLRRERDPVPLGVRLE